MISHKVLKADANPLDLDAALKKEVPGYPGEPGSSEVVTYFVASAFGELEKEPDERVLEKARALQTCHISKAPWNDAIVFEKVVLALSGFEPDHQMIEAASPAEIAAGVCVMNRLKPKNKFDREVIYYIRGIMHDWGIVCYPECLEFAQEDYTNPELKELCERVGKSNEYKKVHQEGMTYEPKEDEPLSIQLNKLSLIQDYVNSVLK